MDWKVTQWSNLRLVAAARHHQHPIKAALIATTFSFWFYAFLRWLAVWRNWKRRRFLCLSSPLHGSTWKLATPYKWFGHAAARSWQGFCPCCKRPIDVQTCEPWAPHRIAPARRGKYAFVINLWGSSVEYIFGALVLGQSIKLTKSPHARICLYTEDVPKNFIKLLSKLWDCRPVQHVHAISQLSFVDQAHRFAKVFTKLRVLALEEFEKVLVLDIDLLVMSNIDHLFELRAPAAMRRGMNESKHPYRHGDPIDGRHFFQGTDWRSAVQGQNPWSWGQGTGINAGVMLLQPDRKVLDEMLMEIAEPNHPSHITSNGPEQDYLSRYWADAPWTHIGVENNFQLHQMFFALQPDRIHSAERAVLLRTPDKIKVVHFSGTALAKPWQRLMHENFATYWPDRSRDADYLEAFAGEFAGYWLWVKRDASTWKARSSYRGPKGRLDLDTTGMHLGDDGHIYRQTGEEGAPPTRVDIPEELTQSSMDFLAWVLGRWFDMFENLEQELGLRLRHELVSDAPTVETLNPALSTTFKDTSKGSNEFASSLPLSKLDLVGHPSGTLNFHWQREPCGWWMEHNHKGGTIGTNDTATNGYHHPKVVVTCSAVTGLRFVKFIENGVETYEEEGQDVAGVFAKVVGSPCARHYSVPSNRDLEETLAALCLWIDGVPVGAIVLVALMCIEAKALKRVLAAMAPLGMPNEIPPESNCALAAVCLRSHPTNCSNGKSFCARHASSDIAYASMPMM